MLAAQVDFNCLGECDIAAAGHLQYLGNGFDYLGRVGDWKPIPPARLSWGKLAKSFSATCRARRFRLSRLVPSTSPTGMTPKVLDFGNFQLMSHKGSHLGRQVTAQVGLRILVRIRLELQ